MTTRRQTLRLTTIATLLVAAAGGWWWLHQRSPPDARGAPTATFAATPDAAPQPSKDATVAQDAMKTASPAGPARPLPPDDTPLADVFAELKSRADAGDAHAACRLAVDLLDCGAIERNAAQQFDRLRTREDMSDRKGELDEANRYADMQARLLAARQRCARIDADQIAMAGDYLRRAAKAGVPEAMLRYAVGQGFGGGSPLAALRDPGFDAWRRDAPAMMQASLRDGQPEAVAMLADAYRDDDTLLFSALVPNDTVQARAYHVLRQRLLGRAGPADTSPVTPEVLAQMRAAGIDTRAMSPTPDQLRQADAHAGRLYRDYFGGRPLADPKSIGQWLSVGPRLGTGPDDPAAPARCD